MKNLYSALFALILFVAVALTANITSAQVMVNDSVKMNAGYAKEVYYSFANGIVDTVPRNTWDIAFRTGKVSSSILINDGMGVVLWAYPHADTAGWASLDTAGIKNWVKMYNDPKDWENGAFSRHAVGHPDYGWGVYNSVTHDLVGDSVFVIKLRDASYRKIAITRKNSINDIYYVRFANVDGTNQQDVILDLTPYLNANKEFVGYSIQTAQFVDFQPVKTTWDVVFTKYMSVQPNGTPYPTVGVLNNPKVKSNRFQPVPVSYSDWASVIMDSTRSPIGWNWKVFDNVNFVYHVVDSLVFFVKDLSHDIYKLRFTAFDYTIGKIVFSKGRVSMAGVPEISTKSTGIAVYPNPSSDVANIVIVRDQSSNAKLSMYDLTGRLVDEKNLQIAGKQENIFTIDVRSLKNGIYFLSLNTGSELISDKIIIQK